MSFPLLSVIFCVLINLGGACATMHDLCLCVFACSYDGTTSFKAAYEEYIRHQNYWSLDNKMAIFLKPLFSRDIACFQYE